MVLTSGNIILNLYLLTINDVVLQTLYDQMFISVYNVFYTSLPVLAFGIFDQVRVSIYGYNITFTETHLPFFVLCLDALSI